MEFNKLKIKRICRTVILNQKLDVSCRWWAGELSPESLQWQKYPAITYLSLVKWGTWYYYSVWDIWMRNPPGSHSTGHLRWQIPSHAPRGDRNSQHRATEMSLKTQTELRFLYFLFPQCQCFSVGFWVFAWNKFCGYFHSLSHNIKYNT